MKKIILLSLIISSLDVFAWTHINQYRPAFSSTTVTVNAASTTCANAGITSSTELLDLAMEAVDDYWNAVPSANVEFKRGSVLSADVSAHTTVGDMITASGSTNTIIVGCNANGSSFSDANAGILGIGNIACSGANCAGGLLINAHANTSVDTLSTSDLVATMAHEIGHALGLGHSSNDIALMYYQVGGKTQDALTQDDIDGLSYLYPQTKMVSCGTIMDVNSSATGGDGVGFFYSLLLGFILSLGLGLKAKKRRAV
ncbi:MAG: hypothetical protein ACI9QD_000323 [Thermoproteota archaeon]|jgi:hypothetical protein